MSMKSIKIDLKDWVIIIGRHLGDYTQMCIKHYCESTVVNEREQDALELYFDNVKTNMKRLEKFVKKMRTPKGTYTFKGYEDLDFLFCFVQYVINNDTDAKRSDRFLEVAIDISSLISDEAREVDEIEYSNDALKYKDYLYKLKIDNKKGR